MCAGCRYLSWPGLAPGAATGGEAWHCSPADRAWLGGDHVLRYIFDISANVALDN